jgi:predicted phage terminase large subunit-like protein
MARSTDAARELAIRAEAQADLYFFARFMFRERRGYKWLHNWHHRLICDALMRVYRGESTRLIINIPPRYSKTELAVVNFMAWCLGHAPDSEFIYTSYSSRLASNYSYETRNLIQHPAYARVFPGMDLMHNSSAKDEWRTSAGGLVYAVGAGGTITGYGAGKERPEFGGAIIIDDPHKADEARSDIMRANVIDWFQNTLESRKNSPSRTPIILIMQRLHEEDLAGWLLAGENGEHWEHLNLPAITDAKEALWPAKHSIEQLRVMEKASPYVFAGQYLQRPAPLAGGFFKPDRIEIVDALPADVGRGVRAWDLAATADGGDSTAGALLYDGKDGFWYIAHMVHGQMGPDDVEAAMLNTARMDGSGIRVRIPQDPGQAGKAQIKSLTRKLSGYAVTALSVTGDKVTRAMPLAAQVNVGNVRMVRGDWNRGVIEEMRNFPNAKHDDRVDALADAFNELNRVPERKPLASGGNRTF